MLDNNPSTANLILSRKPPRLPAFSMPLISESNGLAEPPLTTRGQKQNIAAPPRSPDFLNRCPGEGEVENQQKHCFIHNEENEDHIRKDPEQFRGKEASLAMKPSVCKHGRWETGREMCSAPFAEYNTDLLTFVVLLCLVIHEC